MQASKVKISAKPESMSLLDSMFGDQGEEVVAVGSQLSEQQLLQAIAEQQSVKVLSFKNAAEVFGGFRYPLSHSLSCLTGIQESSHQ